MKSQYELMLEENAGREFGLPALNSNGAEMKDTHLLYATDFQLRYVSPMSSLYGGVKLVAVDAGYTTKVEEVYLESDAVAELVKFLTGLDSSAVSELLHKKSKKAG